MESTKHFHVTLKSGRHVQFFANLDTGLLVVDVVNADETGGNECVRLNANQVHLPSARELRRAR